MKDSDVWKYVDRTLYYDFYIRPHRPEHSNFRTPNPNGPIQMNSWEVA